MEVSIKVRSYHSIWCTGVLSNCVWHACNLLIFHKLFCIWPNSAWLIELYCCTSVMICAISVTKINFIYEGVWSDHAGIDNIQYHIQASHSISQNYFYNRTNHEKWHVWCIFKHTFIFTMSFCENFNSSISKFI